MPAPYRTQARSELARLRRSIDDLFLRAWDIDAESELAGDINRYLCVRICGLLEQMMLTTGRSAVEGHSWGIGQNFALSWLERSKNPSADTLEAFIGRFSSAWRDDLVALLKEEERRSRINSLVGIRNDVAHGKNQGVSTGQAFDYYVLVVEIVDHFLDRLEPVPGALSSPLP
jgi:hypothetical protein